MNPPTSSYTSRHRSSAAHEPYDSLIPGQTPRFVRTSHHYEPSDGQLYLPDGSVRLGSISPGLSSLEGPPRSNQFTPLPLYSESRTSLPLLNWSAPSQMEAWPTQIPQLSPQLDETPRLPPLDGLQLSPPLSTREWPESNISSFPLTEETEELSRGGRRFIRLRYTGPKPDSSGLPLYPFRLLDCAEYIRTGVLRLHCFEYPQLCASRMMPWDEDLRDWETVGVGYPWLAVIHGDDGAGAHEGRASGASDDAIDRGVLQQLCEAALKLSDENSRTKYLWLDVLCTFPTERARGLWCAAHNIEKVFRYATRVVVLLNGLREPIPLASQPRNQSAGNNWHATVKLSPAIIGSFTVFLQLMQSSRCKEDKIWVLFEWRNNIPLINVVLKYHKQVGPVEQQWVVESNPDCTVSLAQFDAYLNASIHSESKHENGGILMLYGFPDEETWGKRPEILAGGIKVVRSNDGGGLLPLQTRDLPERYLQRVLHITRRAHTYGPPLRSIVPSSAQSEEIERWEFLIWANALQIISGQTAYLSAQFVFGLTFLLQDVWARFAEFNSGVPMLMDQLHGLDKNPLGQLSVLVHHFNMIKDLSAILLSELQEFEYPVALPLDTSGDRRGKMECYRLTLVVDYGEGFGRERLALCLDAVPFEPPASEPRTDGRLETVHVALMSWYDLNGDSISTYSVVAMELNPGPQAQYGRLGVLQSDSVRVQYWEASNWKVIQGVPAQKVVDAGIRDPTGERGLYLL